MTTAKRPRALEPEDLSVRVRRGDSSVEERRALEHALEGSALLRTSHQVGRDFDEAAGVRPGDDELIMRASARALSRAARRRGSRSVWLFGIAATLAIASSAAAAGYWLSSATAGENRDATTRVGNANEKRHPSDSPRPSPAETGAKSVPEPKPIPSTRPRPDAALPSRRAEGTQDSTEKTGADLFREANAARRAGDFELARALYAELQAKHPATDEAGVSRVSLGKLLLTSGRAREADLQFKSYLATGRKNLEEEALVGRADALGRLGESGEERRVWEGLLRSYPSSVYAARARQRLGELGAADASQRP